ncbi:unnamed protein product [Macrosiphum euphorbiae]|uniref:Uncharacterized protein n=1 Tax=Macrosiphum euphorbiae TaxID=13131 RepID=A0AAV0Y0H4_9HEMI|nr:unnamed protein product [Macrosiphum euphorbiae]
MTTLTCPTNEKESSAAGNKPPSSPGFRVSKLTLFTAFHLPGRLVNVSTPARSTSYTRLCKTTCRPRGNRVDRQTTHSRESFSTTVNILGHLRSLTMMG